MDIYETHIKSGVSLKKLKDLEKLGVLNVQRSKNPLIDKMKMNLNKGNRLSAEQQLHLLKNPNDAKLLLRWEYEVSACLKALGDVEKEKMPWPIAAKIDLAAAKHNDAVQYLAEWLCNFIDENPAFANGASRDYAYLAVRIFADVPDLHLKLIISRAFAAIWNCRKTKRMTGYWHLDTKRRVRYHRPAKYHNL